MRRIAALMPESLVNYLAEFPRSKSEACLGVVAFARALDEELLPLTTELRMAALRQGTEYALSKAAVVAHLVKLGLEAHLVTSGEK